MIIRKTLKFMIIRVGRTGPGEGGGKGYILTLNATGVRPVFVGMTT